MSVPFHVVVILCLTLNFAQGQVDTNYAHKAWLTGLEGLRQEKFQVAHDHLKEAAKIFNTKRLPFRSLQCDLTRAELLSRFGEWESSNMLLDTIRDQVKQLSKLDEKNWMQMSVILLQFDNEESDSLRRELLERASIIEEKGEDNSLHIAKFYHHWGLHYFNIQKFDSSSYFLEKAYSHAAAFNTLEADYLIGRIALQWAKTLRRKGDNAKAIDLIKGGIAAYANYFGPTHTFIATGYNDLAINQKRLGDLEGAGLSFNRALAIRAELFGERSNAYARILNNVTLQFLDQGDLTTALEYAKQTVAIFEGLKEPDAQFHIASHNTLARVLDAMGMFDKAEVEYRKALDMFKMHYPGSRTIRYYLISLANNALDREEPKEALELFHETMHITLDDIDPEDLKSNPSKDDPSNFQSLKTLCTYKAKAWYASFLRSQDTAQLNEAMQLYDLADHFATKNRTESRYQKSRLAYSRQNLALYEGAIETAEQLLIQTGDPDYLEKAFLYSEKSKSLTLLEDLLEASALNNSGLPQKLLEREKSIQDSIANLRSALLKARRNGEASSIQDLQKEKLVLELNYEHFKKHLEESNPRFYNSKYDFNFESVASIQSTLGPDECVVSFFVGGDKIFRFLMQRDWADVSVIEKNDSLNAWVSNMRENIRAFDPSLPISNEKNQASLALYKQVAVRLFDLLLSDIASQLKTKTSIIPDDVLNYIPFGALLTDLPREGAPFSDYPFFEKQSIISYNYSGTLARQMRKQQAAESGLLAIAPSFDGKVGSQDRKSLTPLLFNQKEAEAIEQIWSGSSLLGAAATKEAFKEEMLKYGIIHFATHALVNEGDAALSYLAFAPNPDQDPYLYLEELYELDLPVQLITLSACETSLGPLQQGEGIASVAQGFSYAGAKSIITSLWDVDDGAAEQIMTTFYQNLQDDLPKDQALQQAKLEYLNTAEDHLAHPFFWASFIPIGDMQEIGGPNSNGWLLALSLATVILLMGFLLNRFTKKI